MIVCFDYAAEHDGVVADNHTSTLTLTTADDGQR